MGTYIKDYDAPKSCEDCDCELAYMLQCKYLTGRESDGCPLVEVKEPHGRLIDADALKMAIHETDFYYDSTEEKCKRHDIGRLVHVLIDGIIDESPTVIEAEEG